MVLPASWMSAAVVAIAPVWTAAVTGIFAAFVTGGCTLPIPPQEPSADRLGRAVSNAVKAAADTTYDTGIAERAVENAEASRYEAAQYLACLVASNGSGQAVAVAALKTAEQKAEAARASAQEIIALTANVSKAVAAVKALAEQFPSSEPAKAARLAAKAHDLSVRCVEDAALARQLADDLRRRWLSLLREQVSQLPSSGGRSEAGDAAP